MSMFMRSAERRVAAPRKSEGGLILNCVPWHVYEGLLRLFDDRRLRVTYDQGTLEIMTISIEHGDPSYLLGQIVDVLAEELDRTIRPGRTLTLKREDQDRVSSPTIVTGFRTMAELKASPNTSWVNTRHQT